MSIGSRVSVARWLATVTWLCAVSLLAGPSAPDIAFEDISESTGIDAWPSRYGAPLEKRTILENIGGGVGLVDLDGDGRLDVYLPTGQASWGAGGDRNTFLRGAPDGRFHATPTSTGAALSGWYFGVAAADYDDDGFRDLYVTEHGDNALLRNNGDGTFENVTRTAGAAFRGFSTGAAWADYDRDGVLDLVVNNYVAVDPTTVPEPGSDPHCRWKNVAVPCGPRGLPAEGSRLLRGDGRGRFESVQEASFGSAEYYGLGAVWTDHDADGWIDLYLADDQTPNRLYQNREGLLEEIGLLSGTAYSEDGHAQAGMGTDWADIDEDGIADLVVTNFADETNALYRGIAPSLFVDDTIAARLAVPSFRSVGWGVGFRDFDNDGDLDLFVANGHVYSQVDTHDLVDDYPQPDQLFLNREGAFDEFAPPPEDGLSLPAVSRGAAFGDVDRDGRVDILVGVLDGSPRLLANRMSAGRSIGVRLIGTEGNRDAVGARVTVEIPGRSPLRRDLQAGHSYLSQSEHTLHFGLGNAATARIMVHWPSGAIRSPTVIRDVAPGSLVYVREDGRHDVVVRSLGGEKQ